MSTPVNPVDDDSFDAEEPVAKKRRWLRWLAGVLLVGAILVFIIPPLIAWFLYQSVAGPVNDSLPEGSSVESIQEDLKDSEIFNPTAPVETEEDVDGKDDPKNEGASGQGDVGIPRTPSLPSAAPGSSVEEVREQIVEKAQRNIPSVVQEPAQVLSATEQVCANLDAGWGPMDLATKSDLPVDGWEDRAKFLALAVGMECPEYSDEAMGWYQQFQKFRSLAG